MKSLDNRSWQKTFIKSPDGWNNWSVVNLLPVLCLTTSLSFSDVPFHYCKKGCWLYRGSSNRSGRLTLLADSCLGTNGFPRKADTWLWPWGGFTYSTFSVVYTFNNNAFSLFDWRFTFNQTKLLPFSGKKRRFLIIIFLEKTAFNALMIMAMASNIWHFLS